MTGAPPVRGAFYTVFPASNVVDGASKCRLPSDAAARIVKNITASTHAAGVVSCDTGRGVRHEGSTGLTDMQRWSAARS